MLRDPRRQPRSTAEVDDASGGAEPAAEGQPLADHVPVAGQQRGSDGRAAVGSPNTTMAMMAISVRGMPRAACRSAVAAAAANTSRVPTLARARLCPGTTP